jgi:hypothetical protein
MDPESETDRRGCSHDERGAFHRRLRFQEAFRGFGSNVVWVDPEHDLVLVLRWFEWEKLDDIVERLIAAVRID